MTAIKSWAYLTENGSKWITAETIADKRAKYGGRATGRIFFSTHSLSKRKRMKHVQRGETAYFSYINKSDEAGSDGGESLTHRLFKQAIASIKKTVLKLGKHGDHVITISNGETEKKYCHEKDYVADVYCCFRSESYLGMKWSDKVYIEVHKSHPVPIEKIQELRQLRLPVIEVEVPKLFEYQYSDRETTNQRETFHVEKIKKILEGGFLMGKVISNPSSVEFLEKYLKSTRQQLQEAKEQIQAATDREALRQTQIDQLNNEIKILSSAKGSLEELVATYKKEAKQLDSSAQTDKNKIIELKKQKFVMVLVLGLFGMFEIMTNFIGV